MSRRGLFSACVCAALTLVVAVLVGASCGAHAGIMLADTVGHESAQPDKIVLHDGKGGTLTIVAPDSSIISPGSIISKPVLIDGDKADKHIRAMRNDGTLPFVVDALARSGYICARFGHQWKGGSWYRHCSVCDKDQWRDVVPDWRDE